MLPKEQAEAKPLQRQRGTKPIVDGEGDSFLLGQLLGRVDAIAKTVDAVGKRLDDLFSILSKQKEDTGVTVNALSIEVATVKVDTQKNKDDIKKLQEAQVEFSRLLPYLKGIAYLVAGLSIPIILATLKFIWDLLTHVGTVP